MKTTRSDLVCRLLMAMAVGFGCAGVAQAASALASASAPASVVAASDSSAVQEVIVNEFSGLTLTLELKSVSEVDAGFGAKVVKDESFAASSYGIVYSTEPSFKASTGEVISIADSYGKDSYSLVVKDLQPSTTYYYTSYIKYYGLYKYGQIKSFTTSEAAVPVIESVSGITEVSAELSGQITPMSRTPRRLLYGVEYSTSEDFSSDEVRNVKITNYNFGLYLPSLLPGTTYYYRSYVMANGGYTYGPVQSFTTTVLVAPEITGVTDVTEVSARISGKLLPDSGSSAAMEYGVQLSSKADFSDSFYRNCDAIDADGNFRLKINSILPSTTYYYRSYMKVNGAYIYGKTDQFTTCTLVAPELDFASNITGHSVTITGKLFLAKGFSQDMKYGVQISTSTSLDEGTSIEITDLDPDCRFSITDFSLRTSTTYYYCSYVRMSGAYYFGNIKSFTTAPPDPFMPTDLSSNGAANCYIVSEYDYYKFKTVKGNSNVSVGDVASAEVLWESFGTSVKPSIGDLVQNVSYKDGYITFKTANTFKEGNAVIAAKDAYGNILWSWHIWLTDQPIGQEYYNGAGTMMDRNLGATSATPGEVGALGLLYQWGRKDPFLGSSSISSNTVAQSTIAWPSLESSNSSRGTIEYATSHPTTFITYNSNDYDWYYTGSSSTDNTRWTTSDMKKSIYDPCPPGWRVPDGGENGVWSTALGSSSYFCDSSLYDSTNKGVNFSSKFGSASTIWYPASGCHDSYCVCCVGGRGHYWSTSPIGFYAYSLRFDYDGYVNPSSNFSRASGNSVRCLQE